MKTLLRVLIGVAISIAASALAVEIYVRFYVFLSGTERSAHANDYGMAFDALIIGASVFIAAAIICCYVALRKKH